VILRSKLLSLGILRLEVFVFLFLAHSGSAAVVLRIGANFSGATFGVDSGAVPADAGLAVSTNYVVELINGRFSFFRKSPLAKVQTMTDRSFWTNAGVTLPAGTGVSDPRIVFDTSSQRWFASMIDDNSSNVSNRFLLAVSATADPTGTWRGTAFTADPVNGHFADFPTFGIDADAVYLSGDLFDVFGDPVRPTLVSIPKNDLLANPPSAAGRTSFGALSYTGYGEILQPAVTLGAASSPETVMAMGDLGYDFQPHSTMISFTVQNAATHGAASLGSPTTISIPDYSILPDYAPQPGATGNMANIDDSDARISAIVYRMGDIIYATHGTAVNNRAAIQWFKINALTLNVIDTGIVADTVLDLYYPAIAANSDGVVMLVFNGSSANGFVSSYGVIGEPINGRLAFGGLVLLKAGIAGYRTSANLNRWGDYSAVSVDPADSTHFWALTMYPSSSTAWSTEVTELIATPVTLSISISGANVLLSWPAAASSYQLQSTTSLSSPAWTPVTQTPTPNNDQLTVSLAATGAAQFFRLVK
jgi:hypothetical protein